MGGDLRSSNQQQMLAARRNSLRHDMVFDCNLSEGVGWNQHGAQTGTDQTIETLSFFCMTDSINMGWSAG